MQPDETDWRIINILSEKNVPNSTIAAELGLSEGAIRQRIKKLRQARILKIKATRDPNILANQQLAIVAANLAEAKLLEKKAQEISELQNVISVSMVSGRYDLVLEVLVDSNKGLVHFLTEVLSSVEGISKTETFLILKSYNKWI